MTMSCHCGKDGHALNCPVHGYVTVPRWALEFVMDRADFVDEGPRDEGWRSYEMKRATDALEAALNAVGEKEQKDAG